ncbi:jun dimerization protein 2 [Hypanus sabinus]|uniref:jun dimerization protein 2 n=1 Tax=Hypanus sabinus TaxID=79690 RepID=UPI0028C4430E|nr:jun dimerization protein 2 [Hypanus sabinus]
MEGAGPRERRPSGSRDRDRPGVRGRRTVVGSGLAASPTRPETCCLLQMLPVESGRSLVTGTLPTLSTLTGFPIDTLSTLTGLTPGSKGLKLGDLCQVPAVISPLQCLALHYNRQPHALKSEDDQEEDERRRRRREKNKVAAARCRNKKRERTEFLQKESERLEMMNGQLKTQIEELKRERQELIHLLNLHRPTCIVRTDSVRSPDTLLTQ